MEKINTDNNIVYKINPQIYPIKLWIYIGTDILKERFSNVSKFDKNDKARVDFVHDDIENLIGFLIRFENNNALNFEIIIHEAIHVVLSAYDYLGVLIDTKNQEHFCYFSGWVAKCCEEVINDIKNKIKQL